LTNCLRDGAWRFHLGELVEQCLTCVLVEHASLLARILLERGDGLCNQRIVVGHHSCTPREQDPVSAQREHLAATALPPNLNFPLIGLLCPSVPQLAAKPEHKDGKDHRNQTATDRAIDKPGCSGRGRRVIQEIKCLWFRAQIRNPDWPA